MKKRCMQKINKKKETNLNNTHIAWEDYFATAAILASLRSKDPTRKVGAVIVSADNKILSTGYNGAPYGIGDTEFPWQKDGDYLNTKYAYVVHAELNAILNYNGSRNELKGAKLYTTLFPCNECMKAIIQSGITEVIYLDNHNLSKESAQAALKMVNIHNKDLRYPKINLKGYQISISTSNLITKAILTNKEIIPLNEN